MAQRVTQNPRRVLVLTNVAKARLTQAPRRVLLLPTDAATRVIQMSRGHELRVPIGMNPVWPCAPEGEPYPRVPSC